MLIKQNVAFFIVSMFIGSFSYADNFNWDPSDSNACQAFWHIDVCWQGNSAPDTIGSDNLRINSTISRINRNTQINALEVNNTQEFSDTFNNDARFVAELIPNTNTTPQLTVLSGISLRDVPGNFIFNIPIIVGSSAIELRSESTSEFTTFMDFNRTIDTRGNLLRLRANGAQIRVFGNITGSGGVTVNGVSNSRVSLFSASNYTGDTIVNNGNFFIDGAGRLPNRTNLRVNNTGTAIFSNDVGDAINGLYGNGNVGVSTGSNLVIGNYGLNDSVGEGTFTGNLSGGGNLTKRGQQGEFTFNGTSTLTGEIFLEEGRLRFANNADVSLLNRLRVESDLGRASSPVLDIDGANISTTELSVTGSNANVEIDNNAVVTARTGSISAGSVTLNNSSYGGFDLNLSQRGKFVQNSGSVNLAPGGTLTTNVAGSLVGGRYELNAGSLTTDEIILAEEVINTGAGIYQTGGTHNSVMLQIEKDARYSLIDGSLSVRNLVTRNNQENNGNFIFNGGELKVQNFVGDLVNNGGRLSPVTNNFNMSNDIGNSLVFFDYTQNAGELLIEISETEFDVLTVSMNAMLNDGKIIFSFLDDFLPTAGFSFDFLTAGQSLSISQLLMFEAIGVASGFEFTVNQIGNSLRFVALNDASPVPLPAALWLFSSALGLLLLRGRRLKK